jgi:hypothetical protein
LFKDCVTALSAGTDLDHPTKVIRLQFGFFFANIPIFLGNGLFHGKFANRSINRDPGVNREFVIVASSACAQDEMNAEGVVAFHTIIFLRYQSFFARLRNLEVTSNDRWTQLFGQPVNTKICSHSSSPVSSPTD